MNPVKLGAHIRTAAALAEPPLKTARALAEALTAAGYECTTRQVQEWERGETVPRLTPFLIMVGVTAPPGGLKYFASAWPELWPLIEAGLNGQPAPRPKRKRTARPKS